MKRTTENSDDIALRSTRTFTAVLFMASAISLVSWNIIGGVELWEWILSSSICGAGLILTMINPRMPDSRCALISFVCINTILFATAVSQIQLAASGSHWQAFGGFKLAALATPVLVPHPIWVAYWTVFVSGLFPVIQYYTLLADYHSQLSVQEPWATVIYAVIGYGILKHRLKSIEAEKMLARIRAEKEALNEISRISLAIRDLTNTPIQVVGLTTSLLKSKDLTPEEAITHIDQALTQLNKLNKILSQYEHIIDWQKEAESFDAVKILQDRLKHKDGIQIGHPTSSDS